MPAAPILFMTGTIAPSTEALNLKLVDVRSRIEDYRRALAWYLELLGRGVFSRLVFVENSGHGMQDFQPMVAGTALSDRVDLLSYAGNEGAGTQNRLYLECGLLRHGFATVACLREGRQRVWKVTGRYVVRNIAAIARETPAEVDLAVHCRNRPVRIVDTAVIGFTTATGGEVMDRVLGYHRTARCGEMAVRELVDSGAFGELKVQPRLPRVPDYSGRRGTDGASYDGLAYRTKHAIRVAAHRLAPRIWI